MQPTPVFLSGESHGQRSLVGYSPWGRIELDMTEACMHMKYTIGQSYEKICNKRLVDCVPWLPRWHSGKEPAYNAGDSGLIPGARRSLAEGNANTFQNSCLENPKTEEPGRLQSMGLQRARHDLATNQQYTVSHGLFSAV